MLHALLDLKSLCYFNFEKTLFSKIFHMRGRLMRFIMHTYQNIFFAMALFCSCLLALNASANESNEVDLINKPVATVNINAASVEELSEALKGIGAKKAQAIVDFRKLHGPFAAVEELEQVKGIGKSLVAKNKEVIVLK